MPATDKRILFSNVLKQHISNSASFNDGPDSKENPGSGVDSNRQESFILETSRVFANKTIFDPDKPKILIANDNWQALEVLAK